MKKISVSRTASTGIAAGAAVVYKKLVLKASKILIEEKDVQAEIQKFDNAVKLAVEELTLLAAESDIFAAHCELAQDFALRDGVTELIRTQRKNAAFALEETMAGFIAMFEKMEDEYMRERAADMRDILGRLMGNIMGVKNEIRSLSGGKAIIVADDLTPSDTAALDIENVAGFITEGGGVTSHVSIMAKNLGIPVLVGATDILCYVTDGDYIIMDAGAGEIIINPDVKTKESYEKKAAEEALRNKELESMAALPAETTDGRRVEVCVNVGNIDEIRNALKHHADGIGLFRTEFLFMQNTRFPTEEEQFAVYREAAELLNGKEVTIRTLDIGGDKGLPYFVFEKEENPFLGYRAIRMCLDLKDVFKTQLKAILRASSYGNIRIMYPMIISLEELRHANELLDECKTELAEAGIAFDTNIEAGMMIETPAAVICAYDFAGEADFFSIGTNDLTQYLLAVDRGNKKISDLYEPFHPAVLRAIKQTIDAGHAHNIKVGMCGEFAGDINAVELLLGMGLDEFSVSAGSVARIKCEIRKLNCCEAARFSEAALKVSTVTEIRKSIE